MHPDTKAASLYSEAVTFSCHDSLPPAPLLTNKRPSRHERRLFGQSSASDVRKQRERKETFYEWVNYVAPVVCIEEDLDGACVIEEPAPCAEDPQALVCSVETRQLPQKRKKRPWVSVCIDDMGVDYYMSKRAVRLRPAVTLSYLPYGPVVPGLPGVREQARAASAAGHELLVHLPMEPFNKAADAGPNALYSSMTRQQLKEHLNWALAQFEGYVGVNNHMGSLFTSKFKDGMKLVLEELHKRDLFFLDSLTATDSLGQELATHLGTTFGARDVFLDSQRDDVEAVESRLQEVEELALKNGHAIAIGHPYEATLEALENWLPLLEKKGLLLMPLKKALLRERKVRERAAGEAVLAITRRKQLQAAAAYRARVWRERCARKEAAELEAQFGDGTVFAWQPLQDAAAVAELRGVLERRKKRRPRSKLLLNLQSLLQSTLRGRLSAAQGGRGRQVGGKDEGERAVRRVMKTRSLAGVKRTPTRGEHGQALRKGLPGKGATHKQGLHASGRRVSRGRLQQGGLVRLLLEEKEAPYSGMAEVGQAKGSIVKIAGTEMASSAGLHASPLLHRRRRQDECVQAGTVGGRRRVTGKGIGPLRRVEAEGLERCAAVASLHKKDAEKKSTQRDLLRQGALMMAFLHQKSQLDPETRIRQIGNWELRLGGTVQLTHPEEARETTVNKQAGKQHWLQDSPRTVITASQEEADSEASSRESSPLGSTRCSLSSNWSFEVEKDAESESAANSGSVAGSSLSGASWEGPGEAGRQESKDAALQIAAEGAASLALVVHLLRMSMQGSCSTHVAMVGSTDEGIGQQVQPLESRQPCTEDVGSKVVPEGKEVVTSNTVVDDLVTDPKQEFLLAESKLVASAAERPTALLAVSLGPSSKCSPTGESFLPCASRAVPTVGKTGSALKAPISKKGQSGQSLSSLPSEESSALSSNRLAELATGAGKEAVGRAVASMEVLAADHKQGRVVLSVSLEPSTLNGDEEVPLPELPSPPTPPPQGAGLTVQQDEVVQACPRDSVASLVDTVGNAPADEASSAATSASNVSSCSTGLDNEDETSTGSAALGGAGEDPAGLARTASLRQGAVNGGAEVQRWGLGASVRLVEQPEKRALFQVVEAVEGQPEVQPKVKPEHSTSKGHSWWRFTVGCVLGGTEDGTKEGPDEAKRPAGLHNKRQVVPLDLDEDE